MRVLMTTKAGAGHFGPLIPFARAFQRAGADVLVAAPREAAPMVRAERLPLWAFDDPPAQERAAIFAQVRDQALRCGPSDGRVAGDIFVRIDARAAFPGVLAACRAWGPDLVISEITEFAGPLAAEVIGVPSVAVGISQQGKEERVASVVVAAARRALGGAGRPHAPRGGDGVPRRLRDRDHGPGRRRADGGRPAVRRPAVERRARRRAGRGDRARPRPGGGRRLREAVVRLIGDPAYRASAQRIAAETHALPPVDAAVGIVRGLLRRSARRVTS